MPRIELWSCTVEAPKTIQRLLTAMELVPPTIKTFELVVVPDQGLLVCGSLVPAYVHIPETLKSDAEPPAVVLSLAPAAFAAAVREAVVNELDVLTVRMETHAGLLLRGLATAKTIRSWVIPDVKEKTVSRVPRKGVTRVKRARLLHACKHPQFWVAVVKGCAHRSMVYAAKPRAALWTACYNSDILQEVLRNFPAASAFDLIFMDSYTDGMFVTPAIKGK